MLLLILSMFKENEVGLSSPAFASMGDIPTKYTCEGQNINPPLMIGELPSGTKSLVLIVDDPDADKKVFDHWVVYNIAPTNAIKENSKPGIEGKNGKGEKAYTGPCPPTGKHHYYFKIYALDTELKLKDPDKAAVMKAMQDHILASGQVVGLYQKTK